MTEPTPPAPRRSPLAGCLLRGLALLFGLAFAFALVEVAGRVALGFEPLPGWAQSFNSRVGYELRPHQEYTYASTAGEFEVQVRTNSRGLHDVEHALAKPAGVYRILILADSYAQAREVPLADNFARRLEGLLNADPPPGMAFEVINMGHFGLGTTQEYLTYVEEGARYDPDLVLLGFYAGNDVVDNHAPLIRAWNRVDAVDFPHFEPDGTLRQPGMATGQRVLSWLRQNLYTVNTLSRLIGGTGQPARVEVGGETISPDALRVPMGVYAPPDDTWRDAWDVTAHALALLDEAVSADGARLAAFIIPDRRQIYDADWQATLDALPDLDPDALDRDRPTDAALALFEAQGVPALNLLDPFRAAGERLYYPVDGHFNPAGHALTADLLADWLRAEALVPVEEAAP